MRKVADAQHYLLPADAISGLDGGAKMLIGIKPGEIGPVSGFVDYEWLCRLWV